MTATYIVPEMARVTIFFFFFCCLYGLSVYYPIVLCGLCSATAIMMSRVDFTYYKVSYFSANGDGNVWLKNNL